MRENFEEMVKLLSEDKVLLLAEKKSMKDTSHNTFLELDRLVRTKLNLICSEQGFEMKNLKYQLQTWNELETRTKKLSMKDAVQLDCRLNKVMTTPTGSWH
jgi:hypothetical protein